MKIEYGASLKAYNTFGIEAKAEAFAEFHSIGELKSIFQDTKLAAMPRLILGGGSNLLFTKDFDGLVLKNKITGIEEIAETETHVSVRSGAGENWHSFVLHCIDNDLAGLENLSLIPGNVGASPMQNIGAYGVEIKDRFESLEALHLESLELHVFDAAACEFGYRESVFKGKLKDQYIITSVTFSLLKNPDFKVEYGAIIDELKQMGVNTYSTAAISRAVINIRNSKLPNPNELGNAGSFFKNPVIDEGQYKKLAESFPDIPHYPAGEGQVKLAAGWLIEQAGWKGKRVGNCGMHAKQALVLVNYGGATGPEIYAHSTKVKDSVYEKFGVELEREVNII